MNARRALVVDDSRSARAFLTRVLERYELAVDGVESAEQAIEYLTHQRPDVIFMDHLMPGMDGFQAVQAIKNNPRTATIPIMMYTSQEGELYLSQARALGAIGVLPKQIKHADVSKALDQLRLLGEMKSEIEIDPEHASTLPTDSAPPIDLTMERRSPSRPDLPALAPELRSIIEAMMAHHVLELRRFIVDNLESQSDRVVGDVRLLLQDREPAPLVSQARSAPPGWGLWLGLAGVVLAILFALQWARERGDSAQLSAQLASTQQQLGDSQKSLQALQAADAAASANAAAPTSDAAGGSADASGTSLIEPVPYGETPLAGARSERVATLLTQLNTAAFQGVIQIRSIPGRFCTITGPAGTAVLASDATLYSKCEQVAPPAREDNGSPSARQSVGFANMISTARKNAAGKLDIQISAGNPEEVVTPYPPISEALTAGEWNRVAAANNRVEVRWQVAH